MWDVLCPSPQWPRRSEYADLSYRGAGAAGIRPHVPGTPAVGRDRQDVHGRRDRSALTPDPYTYSYSYTSAVHGLQSRCSSTITLAVRVRVRVREHACTSNVYEYEYVYGSKAVATVGLPAWRATRRAAAQSVDRMGRRRHSLRP